MSQQMGLMIYVLSNHACATTFNTAVLRNSATRGILILIKWHSDMIQQQLWWQPSTLTTKQLPASTEVCPSNHKTCQSKSKSQKC